MSVLYEVLVGGNLVFSIFSVSNVFWCHTCHVCFYITTTTNKQTMKNNGSICHQPTLNVMMYVHSEPKAQLGLSYICTWSQ